jgi:Holliday junction resolvasome RuvABC ATP-dependent DNA helicase subunit
MLSACGVQAPIAQYNGAAKEFYVGIANALGVSLVRHNNSQKSSAEIQRDLLPAVCSDSVALIIDDAQRLPVSVRCWVQQALENGAVIVMIATEPKAEGIFLKIPRIEMSTFSLGRIREIMCQEAQSNGVILEPSVAAELALRAGGNPALAKRMVQERIIGLDVDTTDGTQYIDGTPFLVAAIGMVSITRFIGIGLGDKSLYVVGGIFATLAFGLRVLMYQANRRSSRL